MSGCAASLVHVVSVQTPKPTSQHIIDDAGVLNRTTKKAVNDELTRFEVGQQHPHHGFACICQPKRTLRAEMPGAVAAWLQG